MDIRQLELFLAVMEHGSVTRAAERVYLSPGAVSLQLQNLAMELETDLFVRSGKRFLPTPAALHLADLSRDVVRQLRSIRHEFANDPNADKRPFHLATGATTLIHRLGPPLRLLRQKHPNTPIQVDVSNTEEMVAGLLERRYDLAIISLPYNSEGLHLIPLFEEELFIIRPSVKPVRRETPGTMAVEELATAKFVLYPRRSNMRTVIEEFFEQLGIEPQVVTEADDTEVMKKLVETGFGYSILPEPALRTQPRYFESFRVKNHKILRSQALAMVKSEHPRALTASIAAFLRASLGKAGDEATA